MVELEGVPGASATRERGKGFDDYAKDKLDVVEKAIRKLQSSRRINGYGKYPPSQQ